MQVKKKKEKRIKVYKNNRLLRNQNEKLQKKLKAITKRFQRFQIKAMNYNKKEINPASPEAIVDQFLDGKKVHKDVRDRLVSFCF